MKTTFVCWTLLVSSVLPGGCGERNDRGMMTPRNDDVAYVEVTRRVDSLGRVVNAIKTITGAAETRRLLSFFPQVGNGRTSRTRGMWEPTVELLVKRADGSTVRIRTNGEFWNEGEGDWEVGPGFDAYLDPLLG